MLGGLILSLVLGAHAHDPQGCPPIQLMDRMARDGALGDRMRHCLEDVEPGTAKAKLARWVLWWDALGRHGATPEVLGQARTLLAETQDAEMALDVAEGLAEKAPEVAKQAVQVALQHAGTWRGPGHRAERLDRVGKLLATLDEEQGAVRWSQGLTDLGLVGDRLERARKRCGEVASAEVCAKAVPFEAQSAPRSTPDDMIPCRNTGHLWMRAHMGSVYTTERDCLAQAAASMPPGPGRETSARLAALVALRHSEPDWTPAVLRSIAPLLPQDASLAAEAWHQHRGAEDLIGADWWSKWITLGTVDVQAGSTPR